MIPPNPSASSNTVVSKQRLFVRSKASIKCEKIRSEAIESSPVKQEMEDKNDIINSSISSETPIDTSIVDIPSAEVDEPANETNGLTALTNNSVTSVLDHENQDDIPTTVVTDDALEATEEVGNKVDETSVSADSAPAKSAVDYRASIDSDPGDYVKVDHIESKQDDIPAVAESVQEKEEAIPVPAVVPAEIPKAVVLEKSKLEDQGGLIKWIDENPEKVRRAATVAAVASAAGLGYLIYARKFK